MVNLTTMTPVATRSRLQLLAAKLGIDPENQLIQPGARYPHEDCGEACTRSVLVDAGKPDSVVNIENYDQLHGDDPRDGTGGTVHVQRLNAAGIAAAEFRGDARAAIAAGRGLNRWYIALWSDHYGDPVSGSGLGHWVLTDGAVVMNPIGGRILGGDYLNRCIAAQQGYGIQVNQRIGGSQAMNISEKLAWSRIDYILLRGQEPSADEYTARANIIADDGSNLDQIIGQGLDSQEGQDHLAHLRKAVDIAANWDSFEKRIQALEAAIGQPRPVDQGQLHDAVTAAVVPAIKEALSGLTLTINPR